MAGQQNRASGAAASAAGVGGTVGNMGVQGLTQGVTTSTEKLGG